MKTTAYFRRRSVEHGISIEDVEAALSLELSRQLQRDGRIRVWGYVPRLDAFVRVVLLEDGETVHNAFRDRSFKP
jgi:hypothetical protein